MSIARLAALVVLGLTLTGCPFQPPMLPGLAPPPIPTPWPQPPNPWQKREPPPPAAPPPPSEPPPPGLPPGVPAPQ